MKPSASDTTPTPGTGANKRSNEASSSITSSIIDSSNNQVTLQERRLDSFARLLEGTSTCAAVCFSDSKLLIATNKIHGTSKENAHINLITQVMGYLSNVVNQTSTPRNKEEVFKHICVQNLKGRGYKLGDDVDNQLIDLVQNDLVSQKSSLSVLLQNTPGRGSKALQNHMLISNFIYGLTNAENFEDTALSKMLQTREGVNKVIETASSILRLYTDLNKLEASLTAKDASKSLSDEIIAAFRDNQFEILREGEKDVHAEMRLANRLMQKEQAIAINKEAGGVYLGISKLCCPDCSLALRAINEVGNDLVENFSVKRRKIYEIAVLDEDTTMDTSTEEKKEKSEDRTKQLITLFSRGHHAAPTAKWVLPSIMEPESSEFDNAVANRYQLLKEQYQVLKKEIEATPGFKKALSMMNPPESDSSLRNTDEESHDEFKLGGTKAGEVSKKKLMALIRQGLETGNINRNELIELADEVAQKKGIRSDIHASENAFNHFKDSNYQYQGTDIEAIGRQLASEHNFIFAGALGEGTRFLDGSERLKQFKGPLEEDREVVGIYNTGGNHWVTFKLIPGAQADTDNKTLTILYKDSFGKFPSEAFELMLEKAFMEYEMNIQHSETVEQRMDIQDGTKYIEGDAVSCGVFALKNTVVLGANHGSDHRVYYTPANDQRGYEEAILVSRAEYAALYAKSVYEDVKKDLILVKQRAENRNAYQGNAQELVEQINRSNDFKEIGVQAILADTVSLDAIEAMKAVTLGVAITNVENNTLGFLIRLSETISEGERQGVVDAIANAFNITDKGMIQYDSKERVMRIGAQDIGLSLPSAMGGDVSIVRAEVSPEEIKSGFINALNIAKLTDSDLAPLVQSVKEFSDIDIIMDRQVPRGTLILDSMIWGLNEKITLSTRLQDVISIESSNSNKHDIIQKELKEILVDFRSDFKELGLYDKLVKSDESDKIELHVNAVEVVTKLVERVSRIRDKNTSIDQDEANVNLRSNSISGHDADIDSENLRRREKRALLSQANESNFLSKLRKSYPEGQASDFDQMVITSTVQAQKDITDLKPKKDAVKATVTLIPEQSHQQDHPNNVDNLITQINVGNVKSGTVICLERKQQGNNLGMRDVIVLANMLEQNKTQTNKITLPKEILSSAIYRDALLYNAAKAKGVMVIGIEGKGLAHSKESPEYNNDRDEHMYKMLVQINESGRNAIVLAGNPHVNSLKVRLAESNITVRSTIDKREIINDDPKAVKGKYTAQVTSEKSKHRQRDFH